MKRKFADCTGYKSIQDRKYKNIRVDERNFKGNISLVDIISVKKERKVDRTNGEKECILANGYKYLEVFPDDANYAITAIYNEECKIIEWYIDIVKNISIKDNVPYFDDLYLDIVLTHKKEVYILDEDELEQALSERNITKDDFELVQKMKKIF